VATASFFSELRIRQSADFIGQGPVLASVFEVEMHRSSICMRKPADFWVDGYKTSQPAVKKEEVHSIPFVSDPQTFLPSNKREIISSSKRIVPSGE